MARSIFLFVLFAFAVLPACDPLGVNLSGLISGPWSRWTGELRVLATTVGDSVPAGSYYVEADDMPTVSNLIPFSDSLVPNGHVVFRNVRPTDYRVTLSEVPGWCEIRGRASRTVEVEEDATASVAFEVYCGG